MHKIKNIVDLYKLSFDNSKKGIMLAFFSGILLVIPGIFIPLFAKIFIDYIIMQNKIDWLIPLVLGILLTAVVRGILTWIMNDCILKMEVKFNIEKSGRFIINFLSMGRGYYKNKLKAEIARRIETIGRISAFISGETVNSMVNVFMVVFYFGVMLFFSVKLALICLFGLIVNIIVILLIHKKRIHHVYKYNKCRGMVKGFSDASIDSIDNLLATGSRTKAFASRMGYYARQFFMEGEVFELSHILELVPIVVYEFTHFAILILGGYMIMNGSISVGVLVAFQSVAASFMVPLNNLVGYCIKMEDAQADILYMEELLEREPVKVKEPVLNMAKNNGHLIVRNLKCTTGNKNIFEGISFEVFSGDILGVAGPGGSGKTALLLTLADEFHGDIDGSLECNGSISYIGSEVFIFDGTILENITMKHMLIEEPELLKASKGALLHSRILTKDGSYNYRLQVGGKNLGFNEKYKIEIARSLVNYPDIILIDGILDSFDPSEQIEILKNITKAGISVVVASNCKNILKRCHNVINL